MRFLLRLTLLCSTVSAYTWKNVKIGGGGGFVPGIVFNPTKQGLAYARTDIGGLYRLNSDDSWTPLTDFADTTNWHDWGVNSVATDPVDPTRVYIVVGMYTNSWDPNVGSILRSSDYGATWAETKLPFKIGGNQPGRGIGERLAIDPNNNKIIYFGAPSGNGLYKSTDQGVTFSKVSSFTTVGDFAADPTDTYGYSSDPIGVTSVVFDTTSSLVGGATSRIFVSVGTLTKSSLWVSNDAGVTWTAPAGQPTAYFPHRMKFSKAESALYISYSNTAGPYDAGNGTVYRYATSGTFKNITPAWQATNALTFGYGGLAIDEKVPGTIMVSADNLWWPDVQIFRSTDSGTTWTQIWDWNDNHYTYSTTKAPWIDASRSSDDTKKLGWMVESLEIDPFDSNHWLYGTGLTIYGGHNLQSWPAVLVQSLADGIEETSVQDLISLPGGAPLLSAVGDVSGFRHTNLDTAPSVGFINPLFATTPSIDYAGTKPLQIVRVGNDGSAGTSQMALSTDGGANWYAQTLTSNSAYGGKIAYSADAATIVWRTASMGTYLFKNGAQTTVSTLSTTALLKADKVNAMYFYGVDSNGFYTSSDGGATFATSSTVSGSPSDLKVHPSIAGDVWYSSTSGLFHSTDFGKTFTATTTSAVGAFALGKGANTYPNIYGFVTVSGNPVFSLSTDKGITFSSIQSAGIGFGAASANCVAASQDTAGLVFVGTNGRGIFYGVAGTSAITSTSKTTTSTTSSKPSSSTTTTNTSKTTLTTSTTKVTTTSTSKTSSSTAVATATGAVVPKWGQCGGMGYTGPTTCISGTTCTYSNDWYWQCL